MHSIMGIVFNCCYNNANNQTLIWMSMQRPAERILCKKIIIIMITKIAHPSQRLFRPPVGLLYFLFMITYLFIYLFKSVTNEWVNASRLQIKKKSSLIPSISVVNYPTREFFLFPPTQSLFNKRCLFSEAGTSTGQRCTVHMGARSCLVVQ